MRYVERERAISVEFSFYLQHWKFIRFHYRAHTESTTPLAQNTHFCACGHTHRHALWLCKFRRITLQSLLISTPVAKSIDSTKPICSKLKVSNFKFFYWLYLVDKFAFSACDTRLALSHGSIAAVSAYKRIKSTLLGTKTIYSPAMHLSRFARVRFSSSSPAEQPPAPLFWTNYNRSFNKQQRERRALL